MSDPLISVIIPVYNPGTHLRKCLNSLINQSYNQLQIILIDDGSTDNSGDVCDEYATLDNRVISIHQPNEGVSKARNKGIELVQGDYIHFMDSDDYLEPDTYEYLIERIKEYECDAISFEYFVDKKEKKQAHSFGNEYYGLHNKYESHQLVLTGAPFVWNKLFNSKLILNTDFAKEIKFREDIFRGEDSLFVHQVLESARRMWFDNRPLYHYVQSDESSVRGKFKTSQLSALKLYDAYNPLYVEKYPELYLYFLKEMGHLLITLYYDMWTDSLDYEKEQRELFAVFIEHSNEMFQISDMTLKERIKFKLFWLMPNIFCILHKTIHGL